MLQWTDVLNVLSTALTENEIEHRMLYHGTKFQVFYNYLEVHFTMQLNLYEKQ